MLKRLLLGIAAAIAVFVVTFAPRRRNGSKCGGPQGPRLAESACGSV